MASVTRQHQSNDQVDLPRENWFSAQALQILDAACQNPKVGPDRAVAVLLHCGLGVPLDLLARLQNTTKNTVAKRVITGKKRMLQHGLCTEQGLAGGQSA